MKYQILATLGALAALTGLSSAVEARPTEVSDLETRGVTFSKNSVVGVESRTIGDDYKKFFSVENSSNALSNNSGQNNILSAEDTRVWQISEDWRLLANEPLSPPTGVVNFRPEQASLFGDVDRIEFQTDLINGDQ